MITLGSQSELGNPRSDGSGGSLFVWPVMAHEVMSSRNTGLGPSRVRHVEVRAAKPGAHVGA